MHVAFTIVLLFIKILKSIRRYVTIKYDIEKILKKFPESYSNFLLIPAVFRK